MSERGGRLLRTLNVIVLSLVLFFFPPSIMFFERGEVHWHEQCLGLILAGCYTIGFFVNYFWLVPRMVKRNSGAALFVLVNLLMISFVMFLVPIWVKLHGGYHYMQIDGENISVLRHALVYAGFSVRDGIMMVLVAGLGYAIRVGIEKDTLHKRALELQSERRQIELKSLKTQLNPHFLFNSLNNIYALIGIAPDRAQQALHDLSNMLRFMIYEVPSATVTLGKKIVFIEEYVGLMRLRLGAACDLKFEVAPDVPTEIRITPLLYITLVENAFKHSSPNEKGYYIRIRFYMEDFVDIETGRGYLVFDVENSQSGSKGEFIERENSGVGLENVRRQLNLLYPGGYKFAVIEKPGKYRAMIKISVKALNNNQLMQEKETGSVI